MEVIISSILAGVSAIFLVLAINKGKDRRRIWRVLSGRTARSDGPVLFRILVPFSSTLLPIIRRCRLSGKDEKIKDEKIKDEKIRGLLISAGLEDKVDPEMFCVVRVTYTIFGSLFFVLILPFSVPVSILLGGLIGRWFINASLGRRARIRRDKIEMSLPYALDWLALSVEAGLDFAQALSRISHRMSEGPLKDEFGLLESSIRIGVTRRTALLNLSRRAGVAALSSVIALLVEANSLGSSMSPILRASAARLRTERFSRAEKKGAAAAQLALLPLAFCIMPATFVVIFGPLIVRLVTGGFDSIV